ncbi:MAG: hypothetical protein QG574_738 [Cyanobacteriota bacterium erpe_2018_sw_21hr_WHONDRS-SW48-000092_B_bin.40]|nr:hypothetical protein [Cyanobacteriota bacterium erpe_2018_sw_21hr_WHONDRS-SW48-000092_B_bin.40]
MPDLSHSLNHRTEFTQTGSDAANNGSTDQESRSRLALDVLNFKGDNAVSGTMRATTVLAGGLMDGMVNGVSHAADNKVATATTVAESFAVGYGLTAVSKMGKFGMPVAAAAGLGMGAAWVYSEFSAGRPQATIGAVSEAYHSGANLEANRRQVAANGGAILFDATLVGLSGGLGMKAGMNLKPNWHMDAMASGKAQFAKTSEFFGQDHLTGLSRSFAGKEAKSDLGAGIFEQVKDIVNTKPKAAGSFADLQAQLKKSQLADDTHLVVAKEKLTTVHQENLALASKETQLSGKMTRQIQEREALNGTLPEKAQLTRAQENLRSAEEVGRTINSKRQEHDRLFQEREQARGLIKEERTAEGRPTAEKIAFDAKNQQFRDAKTAFEEAKTMGGSEAIARAKERVTEAQAALSAAEQAKPGKQATIEREIKATEGELTAIREQRQTLAVSAQELVALHQSRMTALEADPSLKIAHEKPVVVKEAVAKPLVAETAKPATVIAEVVAPKETTAVIAEAPAGRNLIKEALEQPVAAKEVAAQTPEPVRVEVAKPQADAPVKPAVEVAEKLTIEPLKVSQQLSTAKANAEAVVRSNQLFREIETNRRTISDIDGGTYRAKPGENLAETRTRAEQNALRAQEQLGSDRAPSYTRALKIVGEYAKAASKELAQIPDAGKRGQVATEAVAQLEGMMNNLPNSYKGYREKLSDLREPGRGVNTGSPERRLSEIQEHLEAKTRLLDDLRNKQLLDVAEQQPVLKEILDRQRNGNLPEDGTIVLFGKNGRFINQPNTRSPHFIEVSRLNEHGVGADGAGFNRFTANAADIDGMVILRPIYENGMKVQLPSKGNGKPVFKKMVAEVFGNTPPEISVNDNFVKILERFGPERQRPGS